MKRILVIKDEPEIRLDMVRFGLELGARHFPSKLISFNKLLAVVNHQLKVAIS